MHITGNESSTVSWGKNASDSENLTLFSGFCAQEYVGNRNTFSWDKFLVEECN